MARLEWNGRDCVNPPEGWDVAVLWAGPAEGFFFSATQLVAGEAQCLGPNVPTEAEAKRACEAALLRLGVLEPSDDHQLRAGTVVLTLRGGTRAIPRTDPLLQELARALAALEVEAEG